MAMDQPGLGSFTEYVRVSLGNGAGFITGWLYWWFWVVVVAFEALVGAQTAHAWLPMFEIWQIGLGLMAILTAVNLCLGALLRRVRILVRIDQGGRDRRVHRRRGGAGC